MTTALQALSVAGRFAVAAAIFYFGFQLARVVDSLPEIDRSLARFTEQVPPVLEALEQTRREVAEVRALVPPVLAESAALRGEVPAILAETERVRLGLAPLVAEMAEVRRQIPPLLQRVDATVAAVDRIERRIPAILKTADRSIDAIDESLTRIEVLVPGIEAEVRATREMIDPTLDRVDAMIVDAHRRARETIAEAQGIGREASEGAVTGLVTGVLKLPFQLLGTLASPIVGNIGPDVARQLTAADIELLGEAGKRASEAGPGQTQYWRNPDSGTAGSITLLRRFERDGSSCVEARITIETTRKRIANKVEIYCQNEDGKWVPQPLPTSDN